MQAVAAPALGLSDFTARKLADFRDAYRPYNDNKDIQQIIRLHLRTKRKGERVKVFG